MIWNFAFQLGLQNLQVKQAKKVSETLDRAYQSKTITLNADERKLMSNLDVVCEKYKNVQENVLDKELMQWKKDQRHFGISESDKLKKIKKWCEDLADIICNMRQLVKQLEDLMPSNDVKLLLKKIITLLQNLVTGTFIIEQQPQQV